MKVKLAFLFLPTKDGKPKYFSYCLIFGTPNKSLMDSWTLLSVFLLKNSGFVSIQLLPRSFFISRKEVLNVHTFLNGSSAEK